MRQTVLGVYDSYADAHSAQRALDEAGMVEADIALYSMSDDAPAEKGPRVYSPGSGHVRHHKPVFDRVEDLFARLFKTGEYPPEVEDYREFIRRGGTLLSVDVAEMQVDLAMDVMRRAGAADIEERVNAWRRGSARTGSAHTGSGASLPVGHRVDDPVQPGMSGALTGQRDETLQQGGGVGGSAFAPDSLDEAAIARGTAPAREVPAASRSSASGVGGAQLPGSGFASTDPTLIGGMQQVTTRTAGHGSNQSYANQQRASGYSNVGDARMSAGQEAGLGAGAGLSPDEAASMTDAERTPPKRPLGEPDTAPLDADAYDPYDSDFRSDYDTHYADTGSSYDEYRRAYAHGTTLGQDERYRGYDWQQVEPSAREDWETRYPESGWERFKAAVRHGWERVMGH